MGKRVQQVTLKNLSSKTLDLGYVGENEHTQIIFDCSEVLWDYPNATASMVVQPPTGNMYPVELTREDNNIIWEINVSDVVYPGRGQIQLTFTNDGEIVKSALGATSISTSIQATGPAPTPLENWLEQANETLSALEDMTVSAEPLAAGSTPTVEMTTVEGHRNIEFGLVQGDRGVAGKASEFVATQVEGDEYRLSLDETGGSLTDLLDDTAGDGVTDKTWTADKLVDQFAAKVAKPTTSPNGTSGQLLRTNGDGTTTWSDVGTPTDAQTATAVSAWLTEHPEATTTVQDGAITYQKLDADLKADSDAIPGIQTAVAQIPGIMSALSSNTRNLNTSAVGRYSANNAGTIAHDESNTKNFGMAEYVPCEANTNYTISFIGVPSIEGLNVSAYICVKNSSDTFISKTSVGMRGNGVAIFTTPANSAKIHAYVYYSSGMSNISNGKIQIEKGTVPTEYIKAVTAEDDILRQGTITEINAGENSGYYNSSGGIASESSTNHEKYTDKIDVSLYKSISVGLSYTESRNLWLAYASFDSDGNFIERVVIADYSTLRHGSLVTVGASVKYIAFTYRKYTDGALTILGHIDAETNYARILRAENVENTIKEKIYGYDIDTLQIGLNQSRFLPCIDHLFVSMAAARITIPHESLYHVRLSHLFGFNIIEANVFSTQEGVYVVNHFDHGKFGDFFVAADGTTDISNIAVADVTWQWITENVRYRTSVDKYKTRPCTLEEFLSECRQQNIIPLIGTTDSDVLAVADGIMGKYNYIAYGATRAQCPYGYIMHWVTLTDKTAILNYCKNIGKPFIYGMSNPSSFTDEQLKDIIQTLHKNGFLILTSYVDSNWYKYSYLGFDANSTQWQVNRVTDGNVCNLDTVFGFEEFEYTNASIINGELVFSESGTIIPHFACGTIQIGCADLEVSFNGTITVPRIGLHNQATYTSDGSYPFFVAVPIINDSPQISISVTSGTKIKDIKYKVRKI